MDASAAVEYLLGTDGSGAWVEQRLEESEGVSAPELLDLEVVNALGRLAAAGHLRVARASKAIARLPELRVSRVPHFPLIPRVWELRGQLTAYGAAYVALAEQLDAELITTDRRLARTRGHHARITTFPG